MEDLAVMVLKSYVKTMKSHEFEAVGKKLREARKHSGLSQTEAAKSIGLSQNYLSALERGVNRVSLEQAAKFSKVYGIAVSDLIEDSDLPAPPKTMTDLMDIIKRQEKEIQELRYEPKNQNFSMVAEPTIEYQTIPQDVLKALKVLKPKMWNLIRGVLRIPRVEEESVEKEDVG